MSFEKVPDKKEQERAGSTPCPGNGIQKDEDQPIHIPLFYRQNGLRAMGMHA